MPSCGAAEGAVRFVRKALRQSRRLASHLDVRIDAVLVNGRVLDVLAQSYLQRPPGRPLQEGDEFAVELGSYQAGGWTRPYRLVLVVIDLPDRQTGLRALFPVYSFR